MQSKQVQQTLHLNKELGLDASRRLRFIFTSRGTQRVNFINKYDAWFMFPSQFEQIADKPNNNNNKTRLSTL